MDETTPVRQTETASASPSRERPSDLEFLGTRIDRTLKDRLEDLARSEDVSLSELVRTLLEEGAAGSLNAVRSDVARREFRRAADSTNGSLKDLCEQIDQLTKLRDDLEREMGAVLESGTYSFWDGSPDEKTQARIDALKPQIVNAERKVAQLKSQVLGVSVKAQPRQIQGGDKKLTVAPDEKENLKGGEKERLMFGFIPVKE